MREHHFFQDGAKKHLFSENKWSDANDKLFFKAAENAAGWVENVLRVLKYSN